MKINLNKQDLQKVYKLLEVKEANIQIADMLNDLCFSLDQFDYIYELDTNDEEAFNKGALDSFFEYFELDDSNEDNIYYKDNYLNHVFKYVDLEKYNNNPYKNNVKPQDCSVFGYKLHYLSYPSGSYFPLDDIKVDEANYYKEETHLGIAKEGYKFLTLSKNNNIWMCITPNEIETMKPHVDKAKGSIITFGLGLGYYAYMASLKDNVKSVTIIEKDENIINLFNEHLLPFFPYKDKIKIINKDALSYIKDTKLRDYDYAFFDLWHNAEDGLPLYLKIKELDIIPPTSFWIEESLIAMYRRCLLTVIEESLIGYSDDSYRKAKNDTEIVINNIYFKTKNHRFNSFDDLYRFLSKENILRLIKD